MTIVEMAKIFKAEKDEEGELVRTTADEWKKMGSPAWLATSQVKPAARRGGFEVVLSSRSAHLKWGAGPSEDGRRRGRIPGSWKHGSRGQFVSAAIGFKSEAAAKAALAEAVRELGGDAKLVAGMENAAALADPNQRAASVEDRAALATRLEVARALVPSVKLVALGEEKFTSYLPDEYWGERLYTEDNVRRVEEFARRLAAEKKEKAQREEEKRLAHEKFAPLFEARAKTRMSGWPVMVFDTIVCYQNDRYTLTEEGYAQFYARLDEEDADHAAHVAKCAAIRAQEEKAAEDAAKKVVPEPPAPATVADLTGKWGKKR